MNAARSAIALCVACAIASVGTDASADGSAVRVPLCPGLTIVTAINDPAGDYETIKTIQTKSGMRIKVMPLHRMVTMVTMTFRAEAELPIPLRSKPRIQ